MIVETTVMKMAACCQHVPRWNSTVTTASVSGVPGCVTVTMTVAMIPMNRIALLESVKKMSFTARTATASAVCGIVTVTMTVVTIVMNSAT